MGRCPSWDGAEQQCPDTCPSSRWDGVTRKDISEVDATRLGTGVEECGFDDLDRHCMLSAWYRAST